MLSMQYTATAPLNHEKVEKIYQEYQKLKFLQINITGTG